MKNPNLFDENSKTKVIPKLFDEEICWEDSSGAEEEVAPWW